MCVKEMQKFSSQYNLKPKPLNADTHTQACTLDLGGFSAWDRIQKAMD